MDPVSAGCAGDTVCHLSGHSFLHHHHPPSRPGLLLCTGKCKSTAVCSYDAQKQIINKLIVEMVKSLALSSCVFQPQLYSQCPPKKSWEVVYLTKNVKYTISLSCGVVWCFLCDYQVDVTLFPFQKLRLDVYYLYFE